jgi:hypothetical protein
MSPQTSITKASGEHVEFSRDKLIHSLERAGTSEVVIANIVKQVEESLFDGISTHEIYTMAFDFLRQEERASAGKYKLKRAIMELGPSGFPFEKFIAALLEHEGYKVRTGVIANGKCVTHEIDVIAVKENEEHIIECKFHNLGGMMCDVKIPLYIHSRFRDVEAYSQKHRTGAIPNMKGWVVTNTRFTDDALEYGLCAGLHLMGWSYPDKNSLRSKIDTGGLYPVTCLTTLSKSEKQILLKEGVVLCKELHNVQGVLDKASVSKIRQKKVMFEVNSLCNHNPHQH